MSIPDWTPELFNQTLKFLGWSNGHLSRTLGIHETRVRRWRSGRTKVPKNVWVWLLAIAEAYRALALPQGWKGHQYDPQWVTRNAKKANQ